MAQFHLATDKNGFRHLLTVATEAEKLDPNYKSIEIGSDKASIQTAVQELLTEADKAKAMISSHMPVEALSEAPVNLEGLPNVMPCPESHDSHAGCKTCNGRWYVRVQDSVSPLVTSLSLEQQISALPMAHQFHIASMIMENARDKLG